MNRLTACAAVALLALCAAGEVPFESRVKWIAAQEPFLDGVNHPRYFRAEAHVREGLIKAVAHWWFDDAGALYVDGKKAGASGTGKGCDLTAFFKEPGRHVVAVEDTNLAGVGGFCLAIHFTYGDGRTECFHTSGAWRCAKQAAKGWEQSSFNDSGWERVRVFDDVLATPWVELRDMSVFMPSDEQTAYKTARARQEENARGLLERLKSETKPQCRVVYDRGRSRFDIGGKFYETTFYNVTESWNAHNRKLLRQAAGFRDAGVHLYGLGVDTRRVWRADGSIDFAQLEEPMRSALAIDPEARFMFCISTYMPPKWWVRAHPDELVGYANGKVNFDEPECLKNVAVPSFASMTWRRDVADYETRLVRHLENSPYASRIFAYRTDFGINHEWHSYGMRDNLMPDCGQAMTAVFRDWLRAAYSNDVAALRRAWDDPRVDFATVCTPSPAQRVRGEPRDPVRDRAVIDYERCHAAMLRDCLFAFNRAIKEACGGRALVGNYCGYFFGLPEVAEGCHLENDAILDSPWVDFQSSPFVYGPNARRAGAPQYARCLLEGLRSRGKVALMEADNSTSLAGIGYSHYSNTFDEDEAILARDFVQTLCWGCGFWYFDFGQGWYAHPRYDAFFKKIFPIRSRDADCSSISEVLVVGDYESILFSNVKLPVTRHTRCTTDQITELGHAGVPFDSASFADLAAGRLKDYKVYLFPNLLYATPEKMAVVEKLRAADRTLLWVDAPGSLTPQGVDPANVERLTGKKPADIPPAPLKRDALRKILRDAGVHVFSEDSASSLYANASYVALHSAKPGRQTIRLPRAATVTELYPEHRTLGTGMTEFTFDVKGPATTLFSWEK